MVISKEDFCSLYRFLFFVLFYELFVFKFQNEIGINFEFDNLYNYIFREDQCLYRGYVQFIYFFKR